MKDSNKQGALVFSSGDNIFFTSDTHFGHENILLGKTSWGFRPFSSIEEHDEALIKNWNSVINEDSIIFHLGDFCFKHRSYWEEIIKQLNGKKYLIIGNHDYRNVKHEQISDHFECITPQMRIFVEDQEIYLSHFPFLCYPHGSTNPAWQLFGHVHSGPVSQSSDISRLTMLYPEQYDVGVDNNNYKPISFNEVKKIIQQNKANETIR